MSAGAGSEELYPGMGDVRRAPTATYPQTGWHGLQHGDLHRPVYGQYPSEVLAHSGLPSTAPVYGQLTHQYGVFAAAMLPAHSTVSGSGPGRFLSAYPVHAEPPPLQTLIPKIAGTSGGKAQIPSAYAACQTALKKLFKNINDGVLVAASKSLLEVSDWLLSNVCELGLTRDDPNLHGDRIKFWNDFNHAWLATCQRQKEMTESCQQIQRPQSLITLDGLEEMGKELLRLCNGIEKYGLVDYQYGVWEEQIVAALVECLDLCPEDGPAAPSEDPDGETLHAPSTSRRTTGLAELARFQFGF